MLQASSDMSTVIRGEEVHTQPTSYAPYDKRMRRGGLGTSCISGPATGCGVPHAI
jgi:hypothetical protein